MKLNQSELEKLLAVHLEHDRLLEAKLEYRFSLLWKYRFDFAWPALMLAAEVEGGTWAGGRHTRGKGFENDCMKYNIATLEGWRILRFTGEMIRNGGARRMIAIAIEEYS